MAAMYLSLPLYDTAHCGLCICIVYCIATQSSLGYALIPRGGEFSTDEEHVPAALRRKQARLTPGYTYRDSYTKSAAH
jgi:hypothetical protein